jgi:hypothetical protein
MVAVRAAQHAPASPISRLRAGNQNVGAGHAKRALSTHAKNSLD